MPQGSTSDYKLLALVPGTMIEIVVLDALSDASSSTMARNLDSAWQHSWRDRCLCLRSGRPYLMSFTRPHVRFLLFAEIMRARLVGLAIIIYALWFAHVN